MEELRIVQGSTELVVKGGDPSATWAEVDFEVEGAEPTSNPAGGEAKFKLDRSNVALLIRYLSRWRGSA